MGDFSEILGRFDTKSAFLCAFTLQNPHFLAFRAQNRGFCVRMCDFSEILGRFDTKSSFLYAFGVWNPRFRPFRAQHRAFCAREEGKGGISKPKHLVIIHDGGS